MAPAFWWFQGCANSGNTWAERVSWLGNRKEKGRTGGSAGVFSEVPKEVRREQEDCRQT